MRVVATFVLAILALMGPLPAEERGATHDELRVLADFSGALDARHGTRMDGDRGARLTDLARARRKVLARLVRDDPRTALTHAIDRGRRATAPRQVRDLLEDEISSEGAYVVIATNTGEPGAQPVRRTAIIGGRTFEVSTFDHGLAQGSSQRRSLYGIAIDGVLALSPDRLRPLQPGEKPSPGKTLADQRCPVSGKAAGADQEPADGEADMIVESGDTVIPLCSAIHRESLEARLAAEEGGTIPSGPSSPQASPWTTGAKTLLYIIARFPEEVGAQGQPVWPATVSEAQNSTISCSNLLQACSYGQTSLIPTVVQVTMPNSRSYYQSSPHGLLLGDARTAAGTLGYNAFAHDLDVVRYTAIWGFQGQAYVGFRGCWLQNSNSGVMLHELGHNLGLMHANAWNSPTVIGAGSNHEYGDSHSGMSQQLGSQFNAYERWTMGWLPAGNVRTVTSSGVHRLVACDVRAPAASESFALRITKDQQRDYWISRRDSLNNQWARNGVLLHWDEWYLAGIGTSNGGGQLLDTTPGSSDGRKDASLIYGRTFSDPFAGIHITPLPTGTGASGIPTGVDVVVNVGAFPGNRPPTITVTGPATLTVGAPGLFTATSADPDGDALSHAWTFGDGGLGFVGTSQTRSWTTAGDFPVVVAVSDMKGGVAQETLMVRVGTPTTWRIAGRVSTTGGSGVMGATLVAGTRSATSDSDGSYVISGLPAGSHTVTAAKPGWQVATGGFANPVTVGPNATAIDFTATLQTWTISGVVRDETLAGIPGVTVSDGTRTAVTSTAGAYALNGVPDGTYVVTASTPGTTLIPNGWSTPIEVAGANQTNRHFTTLPMLSIVATDPTATETGSTSGTYTITRAPVMSTALNVQLTWSGTAGAPDVNYRPTLVSIPANLASVSFGVRAVDDSVVEGDETIVATIVPNVNHRVAIPTATVVIADNDVGDGSPVVTIAASDPTADEAGSAPGSVVVTRDQAAATPLTVDITWSGTTGAADVVARPAAVTIPANQTSAVVVVTPIDDVLVEGDETAIATLAAGAGYVLGSPAAATVTIADDDPVVVTIAASDATATEAGTTTGAFTVTRTPALATPLTIGLTWSGTAGAADVVARPATVTISANQTSAVVVVTPIDDALVEGTESVVGTLAPGVGYVLGASTSASLGIADDDPATGVLLSVSANVPTAGEGGAVGEWTFALSTPAPAPVTITYAISGSAAAGFDHLPLSGTASIPIGASTVSLTLAPIDDLLFEGPESVVLQVTAVTGATLVPAAPATVTISDDESLSGSTIWVSGSAQSGVATIFGTSSNAERPTSLDMTWTWGDGTTSVGTGTTSSHIFANPGTYTITVVITDPLTTQTFTSIATVTVVAASSAASADAARFGGGGGGCGLGSGLALLLGLLALQVGWGRPVMGVQRSRRPGGG